MKTKRFLLLASMLFLMFGNIFSQTIKLEADNMEVDESGILRYVSSQGESIPFAINRVATYVMDGDWIIEITPEGVLALDPSVYTGSGEHAGNIEVPPNPGTVREFLFSVFNSDKTESRTVTIIQYGENDIAGCMDPDAINYDSEATIPAASFGCIYPYLTLMVEQYEVSESEAYELTVSPELVNIEFAIYAFENSQWKIEITPAVGISIKSNIDSGTGNLESGTIIIEPNRGTVRTFEFSVSLADNSMKRTVIITQYGENDIYGCMDPNASNYEPQATVPAVTHACVYGTFPEVVFGCMERGALNYNPEANSWSPNYPCVYDEIIPGCTDRYATNFDPEANSNDGSCIYRIIDENEDVYGCMDRMALNFNPVATISTPDRCVYEREETSAGCTDPEALNYDPYAKDYIKESCVYAAPDRKYDALVPEEPDAVVGTFTQENCDLVGAIYDMGIPVYSITIVKVEPSTDKNTRVSWEIVMENGYILATTADYPIPYSLLEGKDILFYLSIICDIPTVLRSANPDLSYTFSAVYSVLSSSDISLPEQETKKWTVYPNPTNGLLTIENGGLKIENAAIYDIVGKKLSTLNFQPSTQIDISHLPAGIYILKGTNADGKVESVRVVKK